MESSKVRTALDEMDDKGDGAFKVRLPSYGHVAALEPAGSASTSSSAEHSIVKIGQMASGSAQGVAVQGFH